MAGKLKTKNDDEAELNRTYDLGISEGLNRGADLLAAEAQTYFSEDKDEEAKLLRKWSKILKERADQAHPGVPQ